MKRVFATLLLTVSGATFPLAAVGQEAPVPPADFYDTPADSQPFSPPSGKAPVGEPTPLTPEDEPTPLEAASPTLDVPAPQSEAATPKPRPIPQSSRRGTADRAVPARNREPAVPREPLPLDESVEQTTPEDDVVDRQSPPAEPRAVSVPDGQTEDPPTEVITERYPNRAIKIERHVAQDSNRNFVNHGPWMMYAQDGTLIGKGRYEFGKRQGEWQRLYDSKSDRVVGKLAKHFKAPFVGIATFVDDKLHGSWKIMDGQQRLVRSWEFRHGRPHGPAITYFPNGRKHTEMTFVDAALDGVRTEWDSSGNVVKEIEYRDGRSTTPYVKKFPNGGIQFSGHYLGPKELIRTEVDYWEGVVEPSVVKKEGKPKRHGRWTEYYEHGGKKFEGEFDDEQPIGLHMWWYPNGQQMAEGRFEQGKAQGHWTFWHENGQKQKDGSFQAGVQIGTWIHWKTDGKVQEMQEHALSPILPQQARPLTAAGEVVRQEQPTRGTQAAPPASTQSSRRAKQPSMPQQRTQYPSRSRSR